MDYVTGLNRNDPDLASRVVHAAIYVRISSDKIGEGKGVKRQEAECRALCERLGWIVVEVFVDNDISASSGQARPRYESMLAGIRQGRFNAVAAQHPDRLYRRLRELADFLEIVTAHKLQVQAVNAGEVDLSTAAGKLQATLLGAIATHESEHRSERVKSKHLELAAAGKASGGGYRSFGYRQIFDRDERPHRLLREELEPAEAGHIRDWARRVLAGHALSAVRRDINAAGILTTAGNPWTNATLARLLMSARISGRREHRPVVKGQPRPLIGEITGKAEWPAIISETDSDLLRKLLTNPDRKMTTGPNGKYLLAGGVLVCGACGKNMVGRSRGAGRPRGYICNGQADRGCGKVRVVAEPAEVEVVAMVVRVLASPQLRMALQRGGDSPDESDLLAEIAAAGRRLEELAADHGQGLIERAEWLAARKPVVERRDTAKAQLSSADTMRVLEGVPVGETELAAFLLNETIEVTRRRAVIFKAINRVVVARAEPGANSFDPDRLTPDWRI